MDGTLAFNLKKILFTFFALCAFCLSANAQENLITSVILSKSNETPGSYQLTVKSDKPVDFKTKAETSDSIYFDLKNSLTVDNLDTIYDDVSGVDGVVVQQLENNKVRIYVNGQNAASTKLVFKTLQETGSSATNQVVINRPIREYRPTNDMQALAQEDVDWNDNSFNPEHLMSSVSSVFSGKSDMTFIICLALLAICTVVSKKIFAKIKIDEEPLIGLSSTIQKPIVEQMGEVKSVQNELPLQKLYTQTPRYAQRPQACAPNRNLVKENYALNAYEKSQKNPYASKLADNVSAPYQKRAQKPVYNSQYVSRPQAKAPSNVPKAPKAQGASVDNIKFLESVTKIYEQSGRGDLAQGLRVSINKNKTAV